ncbi:ParH-like protein [Kitasatospora sp. NPDC051853]|uniref:ParH-like protein n=1 Tax=Kitasatospora sp. NPDC051853 TaxID=3364058 RepID=UPI0037A00743
MKDGERRRLWRRCRELAETLALPDPFELPALGEVLSAQLGRPVEFLPLPAGAAGTCGVLISTERAEYIGYPTDTTPLHQQHIVLHEVGHLLCGHQDARSAADGGGVTGLLPHLSGELVRRVLGRSSYDSTQEQEAELFASLVLHRAAGLQDPSGSGAGRPGEESEEAVRLGGIFDSPGRRLRRPSSAP